MKFSTPETQCAEGIFEIQYAICAVNFTNKISRSSWTWHNLWKFLTINFRNKYFHNSFDWSGLFLQVYILSWMAKVLRFTVFRLLENPFVKLPSPYHDLINNPPCRTIPQYICSKQFVPHLPWTGSLYTLWGVTLCPCSIGKSCGGVSLNICKKVQNKTC